MLFLKFIDKSTYFIYTSISPQCNSNKFGILCYKLKVYGNYILNKLRGNKMERQNRIELKKEINSLREELDKLLISGEIELDKVLELSTMLDKTLNLYNQLSTDPNNSK